MNINSSLIRIVRVLVCSDSADAVDSTAASSRLRRRRRRRWRPAGTADCSSTSADCRQERAIVQERRSHADRPAPAAALPGRRQSIEPASIRHHLSSSRQASASRRRQAVDAAVQLQLLCDALGLLRLIFCDVMGS